MNNLDARTTSPAVVTMNTSEPPIYIAMEFSDDYDLCGSGSWKWVAKRSWTDGGATYTETLEVPHDAQGADNEDVDSMISALTRTAVGSGIKYAVSRTGDRPEYVAVRIA